MSTDTKGPYPAEFIAVLDFWTFPLVYLFRLLLAQGSTKQKDEE